MEIKGVRQIKEEYAIEQERDSWEEFREYYIYWDRGILQDGIDQVATRYASQFQKENDVLRKEVTELKETILMYKECFEEFIPTDKWDEATVFLSTYGSGLAKDLHRKGF